MPWDERHRGPDPRDRLLFGPAELERLRVAAGDLVWLLNRGYALTAALKLVGDRYQLRSRQRAALRRSVCTDGSLERRARGQMDAEALAGNPIVVDGFNVLATVEAAFGGAVLLVCRDGCLRDIGGLHGSYKPVAETLPALLAVGAYLEAVGVSHCEWLLDTPVSNSGRLRSTIEELARGRGWDWSVRLDFNPDRLLRESERCVATADGAVLDGAARWFNLARGVVGAAGVDAWMVGLFPSSQPTG